MRILIRFAKVGALILAFGSVDAQTSEDIAAQEALDACRVLEDRAKRLECYDDIPGASVTGRDDELAVAEPDRELLTRPGGGAGAPASAAGRSGGTDSC